MSNGDDEPADEGADAGDELEGEVASLEGHLEAAADALSADGIGEEELGSALDRVGSAIEAAGTEADLDSIEGALDDAESAIEAADLPEPEDEDEAGPREELESRVSDLRDRIEEERGPYAEDVVETLEAARGTISDTRWTDAGGDEVAEAVGSFVDAANDALDADVAADGDSPDALAGAVGDAIDAVEDAGLDPDGDAETIAALVEAADALSDGLEAAEEWDDLTTREQLEAEGFYDVLGHRKDYPPEWSALKEHEKRGNADMILLALEKLGSDFMEEHCLDALRRMGPEEALEPMLERADRRDQPAIEILGKIGSEEALDTLVEYLDADPALRKVTLKAVGEIGSEEVTHDVAQSLAADEESVRSHAARALGMIGDPRTIEPLAGTLADDDSDFVRASAAWALNQIGTERALEAASGYTDDRAYVVQAEAEKAAEALGAAQAA